MMALPNILKTLFPNVPNSPGVPALLRSTSKIISGVVGAIGVFNSLQRLFGFNTVAWGVFDKNHKLVAKATSVVSVDYRNGSKLSDYPVEQGAFASYNKVANPYDVRVRMVCDGATSLNLASALNPFDVLGHAQNRKAFVDALDAAVASLELYSVVTPEQTFTSASLESWDYKRETANGATIIIADLYLREVRVTATAVFTSPSTPAAADPQSQGQVQATPVTSSVINAVALGPLK